MPSLPWMSERTALELLEAVSERSPSVRTLGILPWPDHSDEGIEKDDVSSGYYERIHQKIATMQHLKALTIGYYVLRPSLLLAIGTLPELTTLTLVAFEPWRNIASSFGGYEWPEDLFPSLQHLTLQAMHLVQARNIWAIAPLVKRIRHAEINDIVPSNYEFDQGEHEADVVRCLPELFQTSPHVESIAMNFAEGSFETLVIMDNTAFTSISHLPLQSLILSEVEIEEFPEFCEMFMKSCPNLRKLILPDHRVNISELPEITRYLPRLEHLGIDVGWHVISDLEDESCWAHSSDSLTTLEYTDPYVDPFANRKVDPTHIAV
ncbi:fanconi anemia group M protein [Ceratobasidium sp. AG-Ba]|nr:fanconi anemia group M protein [Ceratobasidium sp. AG-Ba]